MRIIRDILFVSSGATNYLGILELFKIYTPCGASIYAFLNSNTVAHAVNLILFVESVNKLNRQQN